jgi:hypothetical protein
MATAKTWLWILLGFFGVCILGLLLVAGAGVYFVSHHIAVRQTTSPAALRTFDEARATFKTQTPILELDSFERPRQTRRIADLPTSPNRPSNLYVLAWNPTDGRMARVTLPFWLLRLGRRKIDFMDSRQGFNFERLNLDIPELERIGPMLVLDFRSSNGERVLIWTQ